jgi:hypothetical protein
MTRMPTIQMYTRITFRNSDVILRQADECPHYPETAVFQGPLDFLAARIAVEESPESGP